MWMNWLIKNNNLHYGEAIVINTVYLIHMCLLNTRTGICADSLCDPFKHHEWSILSELSEVSLEKAMDFRIRGFSIVPGEKMCPTCTKLISKKYVSDNSSSDDINVSDVKVHTPKKPMLNTSLTSLGTSPAKLHLVVQHSQSAAAKRKLELATGALKTKISQYIKLHWPLKLVIILTVF